MESNPVFSFGKNHLGLIAISIVLLSVATFMRGGFTLGAFSFNKAESAEQGLTYEQAKEQAQKIVAEKYAGIGSNTEAQSQLTQQQLAEVDPNYGEGAVLGTSVDSQGNIDVDNLLSSQTMQALQIFTYETQDRLQLNYYGTQVSEIENKNGALLLFSALSSREQSSLQRAASGYKTIAAELQAMQVPTQFEQYHRMKLVYYSSLATMAESMASEGPGEQAATAASLFFALNEKIANLGAQLETELGVML